ncbi:unnamed protein product [Caenorhabditis brenneri]
MTESYLTDYYYTMFPTVCQLDTRYLASKEGLKFWSRTVTLFALPIQILTAFCIIKRTPKSMNFVKSSLLKVNSWCIFSGLVLSFVVTPFNFFPYFAGFTFGLAADVGCSIVVQFYLGLAMSFGILISVTILFENRSSLITMNRLAIKKRCTRILWIVTNFLGSVVLVSPVFFHLPDQLEAKKEILKILPCPSKEFFTEPFLVLASTPFWKTYLTIALMFIYLCLMLQILFFSACCIYYLFIFKNAQVSPQTRRLQVQSFYGIVGQTLIPIVFDSIPMLVFLNRQNRDDYDQYNNNLMGLTIILHNGAASLSILLVHSPYRRFLKNVILGVFGKKVEENKVAGNGSRQF